jgi:photosystem II stability/assembly factor-like uncharacterized protein
MRVVVSNPKQSVRRALLLTLLAASLGGGGDGRAAASGNSEVPLRQWDQLFSVQCLAGGKCFAAGSKGLLFTSPDAGRTWSRHVVEESPGGVLHQDLDLYCVRFAADGRKGWIVGEEGLVMRTVDGGVSWQRQSDPVSERLFKVALSTPDAGCAVGANGTLVCTSDGGANWQQRGLNDLALYDVTFTTPNNGWAAGEFETILHTGDGGKTWRIQHGGRRSSSTIPPYFALAFSDPSHGVALGQGGVVLATADGGANWRDAGAVAGHHSVFAAVYPGASSPKVLWVAGAAGAILRQEPDGVWRAYRVVGSHDLTDLALDAGLALAVGMNGTILRMENDRSWVAAVAER